MPRARSPNRDKAFEIYKKHGGKVQLREIAKELDVPEKTISGWKVKDKWDEKLNGVLQSKIQSTPKGKARKSFDKKEQQQTNKHAQIDEPELTDMQRLFAEIYVRNFNATQAAIKAGYSPDTAYSQGARLLTNVKVREYINYLKELKKQSILLGEDDIVERYMRIAFADMTDFVSFGQQDVPIMFEVDAKTGQKIITTQRINALHFKEDYEVDGGLICEIKVGKQGASLKLEDRQKALDWLANYFEMNPEHKYRKLHDERKLQLERERFEHQKKMDEKENW